jgi:hypothetical protein
VIRDAVERARAKREQREDGEPPRAEEPHDGVPDRPPRRTCRHARPSRR